MRFQIRYRLKRQHKNVKRGGVITEAVICAAGRDETGSESGEVGMRLGRSACIDRRSEEVGMKKGRRISGARRAVVAGILSAGMLVMPIAVAEASAQELTATTLSTDTEETSSYSYADGALGFYEWLGDDDAISLIKEAVENSEYGSYVDLDNMLDTTNPLSLESMKESLEVLKATNDIRTGVDEKDVETTGVEPGELLVSTYLMAVAQVNASYIDDTDEPLFAYRTDQEFSYVGFNTADEAITARWHEEKELWETTYESVRLWFIETLGSVATQDPWETLEPDEVYTKALNELYSSYPEVSDELRTYLTLIDPSFGYTGAAYSTAYSEPIYDLVLNEYSGLEYFITTEEREDGSSMGFEDLSMINAGRTYTVSEFIELFNEYYAMVTSGSDANVDEDATATDDDESSTDAGTGLDDGEQSGTDEGGDGTTDGGADESDDTDDTGGSEEPGSDEGGDGLTEGDVTTDGDADDTDDTEDEAGESESEEVDDTEGGEDDTSSVVFVDVPVDDEDVWYVDVVYQAAELGYMSGYGDGSGTFGPTNSISRADAVMVLWNMAGKPGYDEAEADATYDLSYTDVDEGSYYALALKWATDRGIVSGDGGAGETFRPSDDVTREELAKMLYKYEELQEKVSVVDADEVLSTYTDAGEVSEWAEQYVAWLVSQEVMGVNSDLNPTVAISRAEVAAMAVRVQPDGQLDGTL